MFSKIPETDWRHFKVIHGELLERFSRQVLDELGAILHEPVGTAHDRYLRAYELLDTRNDEMARAFDDFRRSTVVTQLIIMRGMNLLTDDDLKIFSEQTQKQIRSIESIFRAKPHAPGDAG